MAEQGTVYDLKGLDQRFQNLFIRHTCAELQADSKPFCAAFCKLVERYASHCKAPLPQLRILERALCCFTQASAFFTLGCDHVLNTLSSLALSIFELLLFFDQKDFTQDPLRIFTVTFQECCSSLARFQNVHLLQVERLLRAGGPWISQTLHAILSESPLPQTEVECCISSEPPVFLEFRVRYLLSCQRLPEAQALAKCCAQHPTVGQHMFFFQVYLIWLCKTAQYERLREEVVDFSGDDAVNFICSLEAEENDDLLLGLSRVFLYQQLHQGDMHYLCELVRLWSRLHSRLKTSKDALLKECEQLILCATNVNAIFPFIRAIMQELSEDGVQFCVELCAHALRSCPSCDVTTKSLIYKTMASLVPNDLEICRACALLVFFLERSVEAYKMVYILYMHPDQEYHVESCPIGNRVRFETLQTLKKDLYFDPEFWNLIALRTNCLKLINEKVLSTAMEEILEEKWVPSYYLKTTAKKSKLTKKNGMSKQKTIIEGKQNHKDTVDKAPAKKLGRPRLNKQQPLKKVTKGSRQWRDVSSDPTRRSTFWQLERRRCNNGLDSNENRRTTRLSEKTPAKRMIRTPKWLLEDSGTLERNAPLVGKKQHPSFPYLPLRRRRMVGRGNIKDNGDYGEKLKENQINDNKQDKNFLLDSQTASIIPQVILELSLPDNELHGTFTDDPCNKHRGLPQRLFYKPTLKVPAERVPENTSIRNEVVLKAQDHTLFVAMLHCYAKKPRGKKIGTNSQGLLSTATCPLDQENISNNEQFIDKPSVEMKVTISSQTHQATDEILVSSKEQLNEKGAVTKDDDTVIEPEVTHEAVAEAVAESTVEMEKSLTTQENSHSLRLEKEENAQHITNTDSQKAISEENICISQPADPLPISSIEESTPQEPVITSEEIPESGTQSQEDTLTAHIQEPIGKSTEEEPVAEVETINAETAADSLNNLPSVTEETKDETEKPQHQDMQNNSATFNSDPAVIKTDKNNSKSSIPSLASNGVCEEDGFDSMEPQQECEESKLEFCCFICHKDFRGHNLVAHSMFHYRKDECMFCGVAFKNNLKAMMHLSDHLEKLKKIQNPLTDNTTTQTRAKAKNKVMVKPKTVSKKLERRVKEKKPNPPLRKLRSGYQFRDKTKEEGGVKDLKRKQYVHKVNGHIAKKIKKRRRLERMESSLITSTRLRSRSVENHRNEIKPVRTEIEKPFFKLSKQNPEEKAASKINEQRDNKRMVGHQEKFCCPVDKCIWFTVNKPAAFLYHVLENHSSNTKSLELAFHMANNSCSICKRVLYSFEHFQLHVVRHRFAPRHPCPHKGCTARFKTTIEMRRHARKHSPLQAVCCLPECSKLFICQWALILHEKEHFSKRSKTEEKDEKLKTKAIVKQEKQEDKVTKTCIKSKEKVASTSSAKSNKGTDGTRTFQKKDKHAQSAATILLQGLRKRQQNKNPSLQVPQKIASSADKLTSKSRDLLQRKEHKARSSLSIKVLPSRQVKSSQNVSCVKNISLKKEPNLANSLKAQKKLKGWMKITDENITGLTGKVGNRLQSAASAGTIKKLDKVVCSSSKINSTTRVISSKFVRRSLRRVAPVNKSPVSEKNAQINTADIPNSEIVKKKKCLKYSTFKRREPAQDVVGQNKTRKQTNKSKVANENIQAATTQNGAVVTSALSPDIMDNSAINKKVIPLVAKNVSKQKPNVEKRKSKEFTNSSENVFEKLPTFATEVLTHERDAEDDSNMVSLEAPCESSIMVLERNLALPQNAESEHVRFGQGFDSNITSIVQNSICQTDDNVEHSVEKASGSTSAQAINDGAFESTLKVENKVCITANDISIWDKMENAALTSNTNTTLLEGAQSSVLENIGENTTLSVTSVPLVAPKVIRPKFCNKNEILSALKTLVKSKSPIDVKNTAVKRENELIKTSASKKLKFDIETQEDVETSVEINSASEEKRITESTDSSAANNSTHVTMPVNKNITLKRKDRNTSQLTKKKEKHKTVQAKMKKHRTACKDVVNNGTKKIKREKCEGRGNKAKSKDRAKKAKASTKTDTRHPEMTIAGSNEVISQSTPSDDNHQASNGQDHNREDCNTNLNQVKTKSKAQLEMQEKSSLQILNEPSNETHSKKQRNVFAFEPEDEESPLSAFEKALTEYKKRPYMRLPATAYLEEKFTVMPKRRKDMSMYFGSAQKIKISPEQRHRCANCFNTFTSEQQLQWHQQQKCTNLFGFDSDEEGTS